VKAVQEAEEAGRLTASLAATAGGKVPGLSAVLVSGDRVAWAGAAGLADLALKRPARPSTVYLWFSMTKIVTATAVLQLAERGALDLDDPVVEYVPEFLAGGGAPVTVRHLLSHSSGLSNPIPVRWVRPAASPRPDPHVFASRLLNRYSKLKGRPGETARYSNLGYIVLGEVVAAASGASYTEYVQQHLLTPLGMATTDFVYRPQMEAEAATGYQLRRSPLTPLYRLMLPPGIVGSNQGRFLSFNRFVVDGPPYGGLIGTVEDAGRFLALHVGGGSVGDGAVLSPESVRAMQEITATGRKLEVGLGWFRYRSAPRQGPHFLEHTGGGGAFFNMMRIYPDLGFGLVVMGNASSYDRESIAQAALASAKNEEP
jgi:CubicO group peptidase (beta-lactamase class C family)